MPRKRKTPYPGGDPRAENRGGHREGTPGQRYPQRSDLRTQAQPVRAASGQAYGERGRQEAAQRAVPLPQQPGPPPAPPAGAGAAAGAEPPNRFFPDGMPDDYVGPGEMGAFTRPTERPDEPITTGIASGPGAGPEVLGINRPTADPDLEAMRPYLPTLELLASLPNASPTARTFVRRLRGSMPPPQVG